MWARHFYASDLSLTQMYSVISGKSVRTRSTETFYYHENNKSRSLKDFPSPLEKEEITNHPYARDKVRNML